MTLKPSVGVSLLHLRTLSWLKIRFTPPQSSLLVRVSDHSIEQHHITALLYATKKKYYPIVLQLLALKPPIDHSDEVDSSSLLVLVDWKPLLTSLIEWHDCSTLVSVGR
jgi:hypothetical protein